MQTFIFLMFVIIVVCVITTLVILSQNPKGGGLSSTFGGSGSGSQMFGVQRTNEFLDKATWTLGGLVVFLCLVANILMTNPNSIKKADVESVPVEAPKAPAENSATDAAPAAETPAPPAK